MPILFKTEIGIDPDKSFLLILIKSILFRTGIIFFLIIFLGSVKTSLTDFLQF